METIVIPVAFGKLSDFENVIRTSLFERFIGKCDEKNGYCIGIANLKIISNVISRSQPLVLYTIRYEPKYFNPQIGDVFATSIVMMFSEGMWTEYKNNESLKEIVVGVAIPRIHTHRDWNNSTNSFEGLEVGQSVVVKILSVFFDGTQRKYIAELVT